MSVLILFAAIGVLIGVTVVIYIIVGAILLITTVSRVPFLIGARKATVKLTTGLTLAHFVLSLLLLTIFIMIGGEKYFVTNYPFIDTLGAVNKFVPLLDIMNENGESLGEKMSFLVPYKLFELLFIWGALFLVGFILNLVIPPLRRILVKQWLNLFRFIPFAMLIVLAYFLAFGIGFMLRSQRLMDNRYRVKRVYPSVNNRAIFYETLNNNGYRYIDNSNHWQMNYVNFGYETFKGYQYISVILKDDSDLFISSHYGNPGKLAFSSYYNNLWNNIDIDTKGVGQYTSLAVDSDNFSYISYYDYQNMRIKFATNSGGKWKTEQINVPGDYYYTSLDITSSNIPYIGTLDASSGNLVILSKKGERWEKEIVDLSKLVREDDLINAWLNIEVRVDSNDKLHIGYVDKLKKHIKYATNKNGSWVTEVINNDNKKGIGTYISMTLDANDKVHFAYFDGTGAIHYVTQKKTSWEDQSIKNSSISMYSFLKIVTDDKGQAYIYYINRWDENLHLWSNGIIFP